MYNKKEKVAVTVAVVVLLTLCGEAAGTVDNNATVAEKTQKLVAQVRSQTNNLDLDNVLGTDQSFQRYLKQSRFDVTKAVSRIEQTAEWRKKNNLDNLVLDDVSLLSVSLPYECTGKSLDGYPVFYIPLGKWDFRKVQRDRQNPRLQSYLMQMFEFNLQTATKSINPRTEQSAGQSIFIVDLRGFSLRNLLSGWGRTARTLYQAARTYEAHYPYTVKTWYFLNAPKNFRLMWSVLRRFIPADVLSTIQVHSLWSIRWRNELRKNIPKEALPKELYL